MPHVDLRDFLDDTLTYDNIPSGKHPDGKTYVVPSPSAKVGLQLAAYMAVGVQAAAGRPGAVAEELRFDDDQEKDFYRLVLSDVYQQMIDDDVSYLALMKIGQDAFLRFAASPEVADLVAGRGNAPTQPGRKKRRAAAKKAGSRSNQASGVIPGPTPSQGSTRSSKSTVEALAG